MTRRPTIMDVAARAGVSKSTVSLVLQGSAQVRAETRQSVERAMTEIGYVYNRAAANLRSSSGRLVGLVLADLTAPDLAAFAAGFQMALADAGYATVIATSAEDPAREVAQVGAMIEQGVSALVIVPVPGETAASFDRLARAGLPTLQVLRLAEDRTDLFPFAGLDYAAAGAKATRHLLREGARTVAFLGGPPGHPQTRERKSGWRDVLKKEGLQEIAHHGKPGHAFGLEMAERLLSHHPEVDAALCFDRSVALGLSDGMMRTGRDLRIVAFAEDAAPDARASFGTIACDMGAFAADTAARLLGWVTGGDRPEPETRMPMRLVMQGARKGQGA